MELWKESQNDGSVAVQGKKKPLPSGEEKGPVSPTEITASAGR